MLEWFLVLAALLPLAWSLWRRSTSPTREAAAVLSRAAAAWTPAQFKHRGEWVTTYLAPAGHKQHGWLPDMNKKPRDDLIADLHRVRRFAKELRDLPVRDGGEVERREHVPLDVVRGRFVTHKQDAPLEDHGILPNLEKMEDKDAPYNIPSIAGKYHAQKHERDTIGKAVALRQKAKAGAVTLAHIDDDQSPARRPMGTHFHAYRGSQLLIAWRNIEYPYSDCVADTRCTHPTLKPLHNLPSLTVVRVNAGDHVYMRAGTAHIVITLTDKEHLAYHEY